MSIRNNKFMNRLVSIAMVAAIVLGILPPVNVFAAGSITTKTLSATDIGTDCATLRGKVVDTGGADIANYGFVLIEGKQSESVGWGWGHIEPNKIYEYEIDGLEPGTTYRFEFDANSTDSSIATGYGGVLEFTTESEWEEEIDEADPLIDPVVAKNEDGAKRTSFEHYENITFSTRASDNVGLEEVSLYIDGERVSRKRPGGATSYTFEYDVDDLSIGEHDVFVYAEDTSGNWNETPDITIEILPAIVLDTPDLVNPAISGVKDKNSEAYVGTYSGEVDCTKDLTIEWEDVDADYYTLHVIVLSGEPNPGEQENRVAEITIGHTAEEPEYTIESDVLKKYAGKWVKVAIMPMLDTEDYGATGMYYFKLTNGKDEPEVTSVASGSASTLTVKKLPFTVKTNAAAEYGVEIWAGPAGAKGSTKLATVYSYKKSGSSLVYSYEHRFMSAGEKTIYAYPLDEDGDIIEDAYETCTITVNALYGELAAPEMITEEWTDVAIGSSQTISWKAPSNVNGTVYYNVYLMEKDKDETHHCLNSDLITATSYQIPASELDTETVYIVGVMAMAEGYSQSAEKDACVNLNVCEELPAGSGILGDVNSDGKVTNKDRFMLNRVVAGMNGYTESMIGFASADIDQDGKLTENDCTILTRHLANWTGYENLNILSSIITGNHGTSGTTCPPHTAIGGQTEYSHHIYEEITGDNTVHLISAVVWDCVCGVCGEQFAYEATEGYEGYPLPQEEKHTYDQYGICTRCLHRCTHNYVATDRVVKYTGKWKDCGDGTHIRTSVMYIFECSDCGAESRKYVNEPDNPLPHEKRNEDHTLAVTQLDTSNINFYLKHQAKVDRWTYCSARNQGCDYNIHIGEITVLQNHSFVDGMCTCGFSEDQTPLMADDKNGETFYIKWDHDSIKEFVTEEYIKIYTSGSGKYFGIAFYDEKGKGVSGSSSGGKFQFTLSDNTGYLNENCVYKDFSHSQLNSGKSYIAKQQDNYTFHCNESGKFAIRVTVDGIPYGAIPVEVVKTDSNLIAGSSLYQKGEYGYNKVVAAPASVVNMKDDAQKRLWFDLNTPLGELKLIENMPTYEFEFIDESKNSLEGVWQLFVLSGVRNLTLWAVDLPKNVMKYVLPNAGALIEMMEESDENREMARRLATYLEEVDYNSLTARVPDMSTAALESLAYSNTGLSFLCELLDQLENYPFKEDLPSNVKVLFDYYVNYGKDAYVFDNFKSINDMVFDKGFIASTGINCGLTLLFSELETVSTMLRAHIVLCEIEKGILNLDGISPEMKDAVIEVLKDDASIADETFVNASDAVAETAGALALEVCPPAKAVYWTLSVGSSLLGYDSFESALSELLKQNKEYDKYKAALQDALIAYKKGDGTSYSEVIVAMNEYEFITADCIHLYEALRIAEASSPIKKICTKEQKYIDSAESTTVYSNNKLLEYISYIKKGALKP